MEGGDITVDDIIEHLIIWKTPLRLLYEKVIIPVLRRLKLMKEWR